MNVDDLIEKYTDEAFIEKFIDLYSLNIFLSECIIPKDYNFHSLNFDSIYFSKEGETLFELLKSKNISLIEENHIKLCIFLTFNDKDLLIDIDKSDIGPLFDSISKEVKEKKILYPWIYGRLLYDKYFDEFGEQKSELKNEDVLEFLDDTPQGVFQLGNFIVGPLGIIKSSVKRYIPPTRKVRLWHCSDPSCNSLHTVNLNTADSVLMEVNKVLYQILKDTEFSEWSFFFKKLCEKKYPYYNHDKIDDIPITLVYCFGDNEIKLILKEIIDNKKDSRKLLPQIKKYNKSSEDIINSIDKAECFQLLLLFESEDILYYTEKLISEKYIYIPSTEIRQSKIKKTGSFFNIYHECNKLGFRSKSLNTHLSLINLRNLILNIYEEPNLRHQLEWNLKFSEGETLNEKIEEYIKRNEPKKVIKELILNGALQVKKTFDTLYGYFKMPNNLEEEEKLVDKILWKLGFNVNIYPTVLSVFEERLSNFKKKSTESRIYTESEKEKIRSAAVNLFVSLEEVLKNALAFSTWLLLSDHLYNTRFKYNYSDATLFMTEKLNGYKLNQDLILTFNSNGQNTLFPLVEGFRALFDICDKINIEDPVYLKCKDVLPRFIGNTSLINYPLRHTFLFLDIKNSSYLKLRETALNLANDFNKYKVLATRNALEHDRDEFPQKDEIISACDCIDKSISKLIEVGLYPNVYLFESLAKDKHGQVIKTFVDYNGKDIAISELINYKGYPTPSSDSPIIIVPEVSFPDSSEPLRVKYEESSEYILYWKNYPKRKVQLVNKDDII